jgi:hypothetical protein
MERRLFEELTVGSKLFGTQVEGSDLDLLRLWIPSTEEMVTNQRVHLPQCVKNGIDTRNMLLGGFVMSLGTNVENMAIAHHYDEIFEDIATYWLNGRALQTMLNAADNMWKNAKTPKNAAHGFRYAYTVVRIMNAPGEPVYPLTGTSLETYMKIRNAVDVVEATDVYQSRWQDFMDDIAAEIKRHWPSNGYPNREKLAEWVMLRYLNLAR